MTDQSTELEVRKAQMADLDAVMDFYSNMIDEMHGTNFDILWKHDVHPTNAFLKESVEQGHMMIGIAEDGNIACALVVNHDRAQGYEAVPWQIDAPLDQVGIVHIVATRPAYHGRGFAKKLVRGAIEAAREEGLLALQLDTFVDNVRSHALYDSVGFINHGSWPILYDELDLIDLDMFEYVL